MLRRTGLIKHWKLTTFCVLWHLLGIRPCIWWCSDLHPFRPKWGDRERPSERDESKSLVFCIQEAFSGVSSWSGSHTLNLCDVPECMVDVSIDRNGRLSHHIFCSPFFLDEHLKAVLCSLIGFSLCHECVCAVGLSLPKNPPCNHVPLGQLDW